MTQFGFKKAEHMTSALDIEQLFASGSRSLSVYPVRAVFRKVESEEKPVKLLVTVSKRHLRYAVDRNRAKRQMREAYRLQKNLLWQALQGRGEYLHLALVWMSDSPQPSQKVSDSILHLLQLIAEHL